MSPADVSALHVDPSRETTLSRQIADQIRAAIAEGRLRPGQTLPDAEALAERLVTAPHHVMRAYDALERAGLVQTRSGARVTPLDADAMAGMRAALDAARAVQRQLLPCASQQFPGYELHMLASAAERLSGDFHDVFALEDGRTALVAGDVSGHGVGAALVASAVQGAVRSGLRLVPEPGRVVRALDRDLCDRTADDMFVSLFVGLADGGGGWQYVNAGHPAPLVWRRATGRVEPLRTTTPALGIEPASAAAVLPCTTLSPGDLLAICSDGLLEARCPDAPAGMLGPVGVERMLGACAARGDSARAVAECLAATARGLQTPTVTDDLTIVVLRRL